MVLMPTARPAMPVMRSEVRFTAPASLLVRE